LEGEYRDGDVGDDPEDEKERDKAGVEQSDHCLQPETAGWG
jgi:hypothetical protein